ncbi:hypothetical protein J8N05_41655 [Streptomyces sp. BH-SS-21]|uniref:Peptidase inhibitor family I36 n=1 Tax=Streptomyces liliiviolaceus TaxID=2823109 RepID=A0A940Y2Y0_9ACTN|nr:hypothetical protein [Streptomyces liliiviolaceus]MBQ0854671.1 hypothetical protein [Streptomyces liliiviolaceus]
MKLRSALFTGIAAVSLFSAALTTSIPAAAADHSLAAPEANVGPTDLSQCNGTGFSCLWKDYNYTSWDGSVQYFGPKQPGTCARVNLAYSFSLWNRSGITQRFWSGSDCTGQNYLVASGGKIPASPFSIGSVGGI